MAESELPPEGGDTRLERAKEYLAIAESPDSRREAYMKAAEEIASYKAETGASGVAIAIAIGRVKNTEDKKQRQAGGTYINLLLKWRQEGYQGDSPFLADGEATTRAARSHAKKLLADPTEAVKLVPEITAALDTPEVIEALAEDDDALEHVLHAVVEAAPKRGKTKRAKPNRQMEEMLITLELMGILGKLRDLAKEDADSPLVVECKSLMRETLGILDGIAEADDPDTVERMFSDLDDFLAAQQ